MLYVVLDKTFDKKIRTDPQASVGRGELVWRTLREARLWRDQNAPQKGVFAVLAEWGTDTKLLDDKSRILSETFKVIQVEEVLPEWLREASSRIADAAREIGILDDGYINPDYVTPEQEEVFYAKHRDEVMFQLRCLISLSVFEELEHRERENEARKERCENEQQDDGGDDRPILWDS